MGVLVATKSSRDGAYKLEARVAVELAHAVVAVTDGRSRLFRDASAVRGIVRPCAAQPRGAETVGRAGTDSKVIGAFVNTYEV